MPPVNSRLRLSALLLVLTAALAPTTASAASSGPRITVLSNRSDLVSGGDALISVAAKKGERPRVSVRAGSGSSRTKRNVSGRLRKSGGRRWVGLIKGLREGRNTIAVATPSGSATAVIRSHPHGGPVFSGPQLEPWKCQGTATDEDCNEPPSYSYLYVPSGGGSFQAYDPENPPSDVADTTTDKGVTVPFIVREETGYMDRDQYKIASLYQPDKKWKPGKPQKQFNHKLLVFHGASCGVEYQPGSAPDVTGGIAPDALGRGFVTMSTALDNSGHNCNVALQAESLVMAKERIVERYGTLRYTIGTGCSGGSLALQWIANAYPGIYQGILPTCSFPDAWSTATQFLDYHQLLGYFTDPSQWAPGVAWLPTQMADVIGHVSIVNAEVSETAQFHVAVPTDPCGGIEDSERYEPITNPGGVRCSVQDAAINLFGPDPERLWSPNEEEVGHGFALAPVDNVGVQYGLSALEAGSITPAQFVDLNEKVGGIDIDTNHTDARLNTGKTPVLRNAYRSGMINETNNLDQTAIIDCRGPDPGAFHDAYRAFAIRARLDREHGDHDNQLIWEGPVALLGDAQCEANSFTAMDEWLAAVEADKSKDSLADKIASDKPADLSDRCYNGSGVKLTDDICGEAVVTTYRTPRFVAGDALTTDTNKCKLKPLDRDDYSVTFTDPQFTQLQAIFPDGVCDYSKKGVGQQGTVPWQTYAKNNGKVIYGGRPLGKAPARSGKGWTAKSFRSWTRAERG
jgi:hypothetical protein